MALEWCLETDPDASVRLGASLWRFWWQRHGVEGQRWLEAILARAPEGSAARGTALLGAGFLARAMGMLSQARSLTEQSLAITRSTGDHRLAGWALHNLGFIAAAERDYVDSRRLLEESVAVCRRVGDKIGVQMSLRDLGHLARVDADYDRAAILYAESLAIARTAGHPWDIPWTLLGIGCVARQRQDPGRARAAFQEGLCIAREDRDYPSMVFTMRAVGELERSVGNFDEAEAYLEEGLAVLKKTGWIEYAQPWLYSLGTLLLQRGSYARGVRLAATVSLDELDPVNNLPEDVADHDAAVQSARAALGDAAFAVAWAEGQAMTPDRAVACALEI